ncbi:3-deoxy-D-manno-octulosonic acid transferase [Thermovibrio ammonificans]
MFWLYNLLTLLSVPLFPLIKAKAAKRGEVHLLPRLNPGFKEARGKFLLHVASVGEASSVRPLVEALKGEVAVTAFTDYGLERVKKLYPNVPSRVLPLDFYPIVKRFLESASPKGLLIYESEVWPSLLTAAARLKVPTFFVSGKISERAFKRLKAFKGFLEPLFREVTFLARWEEDAERARQLGFKRVAVVGDLKLDYTPPKELPPFEAPGRTVVIWGSTHPGEEELAAKLHAALKGTVKNLLTVIAPRHVKRNVTLPGKTVKRSQTVKVPQNAEFYLVDTVGELAGLYGHAHLAIVGGSFTAKVGGHNPVEPVALKVATVTGQNAWAFKEVCRKLNVPTVSPEELTRLAKELLTDHNFRERQARDSFSRWERERGVSRRILKEIGWTR